MSTPKLNKLSFFMGKDLFLATVNTWVYKIHSYVPPPQTDDEKVESSSCSFLTTAELWFISLYGTAHEQPMFEAFIMPFKEPLAMLMTPANYRHQVETIQ
jgi:hypothetical protein